MISLSLLWQMFSHRQYALDLLWISDMADTDALRHAFRIVTPEETLTVYCNTAEDKALWMQSLHAAICRFILYYDPTEQQAIMGGTLPPRSQPLADIVPKLTVSQLVRLDEPFEPKLSNILFFFAGASQGRLHVPSPSHLPVNKETRRRRKKEEKKKEEEEKKEKEEEQKEFDSCCAY